jgi:hypothetical protein
MASNNMAKRIYTKIGDVFCITLDDYKCYFQYIAKDFTQLNSTVIRVFKKHYPINDEVNMEDVVEDEVAFYAHTVINGGIHSGAWEKVGSSKKIGDTQNIMFRSWSEMYPNLVKVSHNWYIWKINTPFVHVGDMTPEYYKYNMGDVYTYPHIIRKIRTGKFTLHEIL